MPTYLFICEHCETSAERKLTMVELDGYEEKCEKCGKLMRRIYTPPGVQIN